MYYRNVGLIRYVSGRVCDVNDVVVSHYPQRGDNRECVSSRCPPPEEKHQTSGELQDGCHYELVRSGLRHALIL